MSIAELEIKKRLMQFADDNNVEILFAVENGSRAWGMESKDSDYDVRFVYRSALIDYIKLKEKSDFIQRIWKDESLELDMVGFDIYKFSRLLIKSNPNMVEWIESPIVYYGTVNPVMRKWLRENYNPIALYNGYRSLAYNNYVKYIESGKQVTYKKYLYVMRGIYNALHIAVCKELPPMRLVDLRYHLTGYIPSSTHDLFGSLIQVKSTGQEKTTMSDLFPRDELEKFIKLFFALRLELPSKKEVNTKTIDDEIRRILLGELTYC